MAINLEAQPDLITMIRDKWGLSESQVAAVIQDPTRLLDIVCEVTGAAPMESAASIYDLLRFGWRGELQRLALADDDELRAVVLAWFGLPARIVVRPERLAVRIAHLKLAQVQDKWALTDAEVSYVAEPSRSPLAALCEIKGVSEMEVAASIHDMAKFGWNLSPLERPESDTDGVEFAERFFELPGEIIVTPGGGDG